MAGLRNDGIWSCNKECKTAETCTAHKDFADLLEIVAGYIEITPHVTCVGYSVKTRMIRTRLEVKSHPPGKYNKGNLTKQSSRGGSQWTIEWPAKCATCPHLAGCRKRSFLQGFLVVAQECWACIGGTISFECNCELIPESYAIPFDQPIRKF